MTKEKYQEIKQLSGDELRELISDLDNNNSNHYRIPSFPEALLIHLIDFLDSEISLIDISLKHGNSVSLNKYHLYSIFITE